MFPGSAALIAGVTCVAFVDPDLEAHRMPTRYFAMPLQLAPERRAATHQVLLHVSIDKGKTWHNAGRAHPEERRFAFLAPSEGDYWFVQQVVAKDQRKEPARLGPDMSGIVKVKVLPNDSTPSADDAEMRSRIAAVEKRIRALEDRVEDLEVRARLRRLERRLADMTRRAAR